MISGLYFSRQCKYSYCSRYPRTFNGHIKEGDFIFLNLDEFDSFVELLLLKNTPKFVLVTHNSDKSFTEKHLEILRPFVLKIYAINLTVIDPLTQNIPIGFRDMPINTLEVIANVVRDKSKTILCYMNFVMQTNLHKRKECAEAFKPFMTKKHSLPLIDFYNDLSRSKFVLSPEGTGIDCHRIYESLYLGAVPICKKSPLDSFYENFPVIIVNSWSDVTEEFLNTEYELARQKVVDFNKKNWTSPDFYVRTTSGNF